MNDLISRQAAIEVIDAILPVEPMKNEYAQGITCGAALAKTYVEQLPSAQPERKKGKWIVRDNPGTGWYRVTCSECGEDVTSTVPVIGFFPDAKVLWDYCPYCGARMEGADETD